MYPALDIFKFGVGVIIFIACVPCVVIAMELISQLLLHPSDRAIITHQRNFKKNGRFATYSDILALQKLIIDIHQAQATKDNKSIKTACQALKMFVRPLLWVKRVRKGRETCYRPGELVYAGKQLTEITILDRLRLWKFGSSCVVMRIDLPGHHMFDVDTWLHVSTALHQQNVLSRLVRVLQVIDNCYPKTS